MKDMPISNWIPLGMTAAFVWAAAFFKVPEGILGHVLLAGGVTIAGFVAFTAGFVGGGVAKSFAASSLWMGPSQAFLTFVTISLIGSAVLAIVAMRIRGGSASIPVLPAMLLAFMVALPQAPIWQAVTAGTSAF